jgi:hypothetical protein
MSVQGKQANEFMSNDEKRNGWVGLWLVISQVGYILSLAGWMVLTFLMANIYEGGATLEKNIFFVPIFIFPLVILVSAIIAWVAYKRRQMKTAALVMFIPLAYVLLYCGSMWAFWTVLFPPM